MFTIGLLLNQSHKAVRDRMSGILSILSRRPDVQLIDLTQLPTLPPCAMDVDAVIHSAGYAKYASCFSPRTRIFPVSTCHQTFDWQSIVHCAVDLLIKRGHVNFAFISSNLPFERALSAKRAQLFGEAVGAKGYACQIYTPDTETINELPALASFLRDLPKPCGIMLYADNRAPLVIEACHLAQVSVPEQVSLVGVDNDTTICENMTPTLTSILPDFEAGGEILAQLVLHELNGSREDFCPPRYGVKTVIERDSTQDLRCGGLLVTRVDNYLQKNFTQKISNAALAKHFGVSRRTLEQRFREIRGTSIHEHVQSLRLARARHLLEKTTLPVEKIAEVCGYGTVRAFHYAFTAMSGVSPRQYRQTHRIPFSVLPCETQPHARF